MLKFGKDKTVLIKGVAIVFMIVLHCAIPAYWDVPLDEFSNSSLVQFMGSFKLCVGIFTFMVGYGYAFAKSKDMKYSLIHIRKLLIPFWIILFVFTVPFCFNQIEVGNLVLNMFGINSSLNWFSWFVTFFIYAMVVMPFAGRLIDKKPLPRACACIGIAFVAEVAMHELFSFYQDNDWTQRFFDCLFQIPCLILGYLFARQRWFERINIPSSRFFLLLTFFTMGGVLVARNIKSDILGFNLDFFYAPLFIFSILVISNRMRCCIISRILTALGNASVYMWFFHALFFTTVVRPIYQPIVAISSSLWVVTLWCIILTFTCSYVIMSLVNGILGRLQTLKNEQK